MSIGIWKKVVVFLLAIIAFAICAVAQEFQGPVSRHARISNYAADQELDANLSQNQSLLPWLEDLLTRLPEDDSVQQAQSRVEAVATEAEGPTGESAERNLEATGVQSEPTIGGQEEASAAPSDPFFPKPPQIPPLYTSPKIDGEGVWAAEEMPQAPDGQPLVYRTVYRPSVEFPNSIVYMALFNMNRLKPRFFVGQTEPGMYQISHTRESEDLSKIVAITNAMWMQQHARGAGAIFRGQVVYPMVPGMATLVVYTDDSVDILEWTDEIPMSLVKDARQLRHLIVKDGNVVEQVVKHGKVEDAEIGLGGFLIDSSGRSTMGNKHWFLANRTAFGIRDDGNLVFAMGHHVSTKDLGRALVLAGCKRAIHGDANIHNIVCNFYFRNESDKIVRRDRLSPEQLQYTMKRYDQGYAKDFFAFYEK